MPIHRKLTGQQLHRAYAFEYLNEVERQSDTDLTAEDVGKDAHQIDNDTRWMLKSVDPVVWASIAKNSSEVMLSLPANGPIGGHRAVCNSFGQIVYADHTNLDTAHNLIGISFNAAVDSDPVTVATNGPITESTWDWVPQQPVYVGANGVLVQTAPTTGYIRRIGFAQTPTTIYIQISQPIILGA